MKRTFYFLVCILFATQISFAQTSIIYRPGPGANDSTDEGGLTGGKDAFVNEYDPTANYGAGQSMVALPISDCNATRCLAYIQFDLSTLPVSVDSVFAGFTHFADTNYCYSGCIADFYFAYVTLPWNEMGITYSNQPSFDTNAFYGPVHLSFPSNIGVKEYNITNAYTAWKSESKPNYGMVIYSTTIDCNNAAIYFDVHTSDDTDSVTRPYLRIYPHHSTGIRNEVAQKLDFNLYPNPATSNVNMEFTLNELQNVKCQLMDFTGRIVYTAEYRYMSGFNKISIPLTYLDQGLYIYHLSTREGNVAGIVVKE